MNPLAQNPLVLTLAAALTLFAVFAWCVRRRLLDAKEVVWIGTALAFFVMSLVFNAALHQTRPLYGTASPGRLIGITAAMLIPLVLALTYGLWTLYRSVLERDLAVLTRGGTTVRLVLGSLAALRGSRLDALIVPARTDLRMHGGVAGAVRSFGGRDIEDEAQEAAPAKVGAAVATGAGRLNADKVIHAVVRDADGPSDAAQVRKALNGALACAVQIGARRVALSPFGNGTTGIKSVAMAPLMLDVIRQNQDRFEEVLIVVPDQRAAAPFLGEFRKRGAVEMGGAPPRTAASRGR